MGVCSNIWGNFDLFSCLKLDEGGLRVVVDPRKMDVAYVFK